MMLLMLLVFFAAFVPNCKGFAGTNDSRFLRLSLELKADKVDSDVIIVGGGLAGMAAGVALTNRGISVQIFERARCLRRVGAAIGLYPNGLTALEYISKDVAQKVRDASTPTRVFERRDLKDEVIKVTNVEKIGATSPVMFAWYLLQQHLSEALPCQTVNLGHVFESFEVNDGIVTVRFVTRDDTIESKTCRVLIGADGIHSMVRQQLFGQPSVKYYGKIMYRAVFDKASFAVIDIKCPRNGTQVSYQGEEKGKSFSFRETTEGVMTVTGAAVCEHSKVRSDPKGRKDRLRRLFEDYPTPVHQMIGLLDPSAIHEDHVRDVNIPKKWSEGPVVILGDAAHAMTPHMGQGANMSLEDVCELVDVIAPEFHCARSDITSALGTFCQTRRERVAEVQERSRLNTMQSNSFDKQSASIPFERRNYSESFKDRLYTWKPSKAGTMA
jgi:salicylate hydroxylase